MSSFKEILNSLPENHILHFVMKDPETGKDTLLQMDDEIIGTGKEQVVIQLKPSKVQFDYSNMAFLRLINKYDRCVIWMNRREINVSLRENHPETRTAVIEFSSPV